MTLAIERAEGICGGQSLTFIKIVAHVPPHRERCKRTTNSTCLLSHCRSKEKASGLTPIPHSTRGLLWHSWWPGPFRVH